MQRVVVTGSSSGIGAAVAQRLLASGWQVLGWDIARPIIGSRPDFLPLQVDLTDPVACRAAMSAALAAGPVLAFVHAAGTMRAAPLGQLDDDAGAALWMLHVQAATRLANVLLPAMAAAGWGRVVLLGSRVATGMSGRSQYAACKAALVALARSWAAEVISRGVTVNLVSPAATATTMLADPQRSTSAPLLPPIGRLIQPAEVAALVAYLLSNEAAAITGQDMVICGGASLTP